MSSGVQDKNTGGRELAASASASAATGSSSAAVQPSTGSSVIHPSTTVWSDRCFSSPYPAALYTHGSHIYPSGAISGHYIQAQYATGVPEFIPVTQVYHSFANTVSPSYVTQAYTLEGSLASASSTGQRSSTSLLLSQEQQQQLLLHPGQPMQRQQQLSQHVLRNQDQELQLVQSQVVPVMVSQPAAGLSSPMPPSGESTVQAIDDESMQGRSAASASSSSCCTASADSLSSFARRPQAAGLTSAVASWRVAAATSAPVLSSGTTSTSDLDERVLQAQPAEVLSPLPSGSSAIRLPLLGCGRPNSETCGSEPSGSWTEAVSSDGRVPADEAAARGRMALASGGYCQRPSGEANGSGGDEGDGDYEEEEEEEDEEDEEEYDPSDDRDYSSRAAVRNGAACAATDDANIRHGSSQQCLRKSTRIAAMEATAVSAPKAVYEPQPYNPDLLWCECCWRLLPADTCQHYLRRVSDNRFKPRARATLPACLLLEAVLPSAAMCDWPSNSTPERKEYRVLAKHCVPRNTQFGPYVAPLVEDKAQISTKYASFFLQVARTDSGKPAYLNPGDEDQCNWMMYVRAARTRDQQNAVAYEHAGGIYYATTKDLDAREELMVWYAIPYAHHLGQSLLYSLPQRAAIDCESASGGLDGGNSSSVHDAGEAVDEALTCHVCPSTFSNGELLNNHVMFAHGHVGDGDRPLRSCHRGRKVALQKTGRRRGRPPKHAVASTAIQPSQSVGIRYLNKYKRLKRNSRQKTTAGPLRRRLRTASGSGGDSLHLSSVWQCSRCDLRFGSSALLDIHLWLHCEEAENGSAIAANGGGGDADAAAAFSSVGSSRSHQPQESALAGAAHVCPSCALTFAERRLLAEHVSALHAKTRRQFKCAICQKGFTTEDRRLRHAACHGGDPACRPLQCTICGRRFVNNSALSCHLKAHSRAKYYGCLVCDAAFAQVSDLRSHAPTHRDPADGQIACPHCRKRFTEFETARKHVRTIHSTRRLECPHCDKVFSRSDKLRLHALCHSDARDFMCDACGRQFKRKDKLKEHIARVHARDRTGAAGALPRSRGISCSASALPSESGGPAMMSQHQLQQPRGGAGGTRGNARVQAAAAAGYERFDYKCHLCQMGFKRRGMLVNHMARRHPDVPPESVPELRRPIVRAQRDYYCNHCDKVYKSSSKRKAHIMRAHPGEQLPFGERDVARAARASAVAPAAADGSTEHSNIVAVHQTFTQTVGSVIAPPNPCEYCHKEYATKAKLLQHQRKKHPDVAPPLQKQAALRRKRSAPAQRMAAAVAAATARACAGTLDAMHPQSIVVDHHPAAVATIVAGGGGSTATTAALLHPSTATLVEGSDGLAIAVHHALPVTLGPAGSGEHTTDLLTQAMSELTQSFGDFRQPTTVSFIPARFVHAGTGQTLAAATAAAAAARGGGVGGAGGVAAGSTIDFCQLSLTAFQPGATAQLGPVILATAGNPAAATGVHAVTPSQQQPGGVAGVTSAATMGWPYTYS